MPPPVALPETDPVPLALGAPGAMPGATITPVTTARRLPLLRALALLPAALCLVTLLAPPLNHDVAAILNFAERWLAGERLYADLIDVNPPLIFVLTLIPAALGAWTPIGAVGALLLCLTALCLTAARLAHRLAARPGVGPIEWAALGAALPLAALAAGYDFGQREHVMLVAALPYLLLAARRIEGAPTRPFPRVTRLGIALLAAIGFALKPHFLAIPALVEALVLLRRGPHAALRDPVPWVMAAFWLLYLASLPLLFPAYLGQVVPLVWDFYLALGGLDWWEVLLTERLGTAMLLLVPLAGVALLRRDQGATAPVLAMAALGAALACVVQHKGWSYHVLPVRLLAALLAVTLAARWLDTALPRPRAVAPRAIAAVAAWAMLLAALTGAEAPWRQLTWSWSRGGEVATLLRREAHGERLLVLSPDIFPIYPALNYAEAQSTLRTMNLWLLQGVYATCPESGARYRQTWEMPRAEFFVYRTVAEDFSRAPPAAVLVARHPGIPWCGREFDFIEYFSRHPLFSETFRQYRLAATLEGYRLYKRED